MQSHWWLRRIFEVYHFILTTLQCTVGEQSERGAVPTSSPGITENLILSGDCTGCARQRAGEGTSKMLEVAMLQEWETLPWKLRW